MRLPVQNRDLRRYVLKNDLRRAFLFATWLIAWFFGAHAYNMKHQTEPPERRVVGWKMLVWLLIGTAIGFVLFRMWKFFTQRPICGTVIRAGLSRTYTHSEDPGAASGLEYDFRLRTALTLQLPNGKKRRLRFEQKTGSYFYYGEGARLIRLRGLPYPVNTDPNAPYGYVCAACGRMYTTRPEKCEVCGLSVIDPKDLQNI